MNSKFVLVAEPQLTGFTLHKEGEAWEETFPSIRQAVRYVRSLPEHEGELIVLNAAGKEISHLTVEDPGTKPPLGSSIGSMHEHRGHRERSRRRGARRSRKAAIPWRYWLIIAFVVAAVLAFLLWHWPKGFVPM